MKRIQLDLIEHIGNMLSRQNFVESSQFGQLYDKMLENSKTLIFVEFLAVFLWVLLTTTKTLNIGGQKLKRNTQLTPLRQKKIFVTFCQFVSSVWHILQFFWSFSSANIDFTNSPFVLLICSNLTTLSYQAVIKFFWLIKNISVAFSTS